MKNATSHIKILRDFPSGPMVKDLPANAGDTGSVPGPRMIPYAAEPLSLCATATEARALGPRLSNKKCHRGERPAHCDPRGRLSLQLGKAQVP